MLPDLHEMKNVEIVRMKKTIDSIDLIMWCNHDNSAHVHPVTNHRKHPPSKKLLTLHTKILAFVLLIISLTQHNDLY